MLCFSRWSWAGEVGKFLGGWRVAGGGEKSQPISLATLLSPPTQSLVPFLLETTSINPHRAPGEVTSSSPLLRRRITSRSGILKRNPLQYAWEVYNEIDGMIAVLRAWR